MSAPVAVAIVTHDSAADLPACLAALAGLRPLPAELAIVDCASADRSVEAARAPAPAAIPTHSLPLAENLGFAGGMNRALAATEAFAFITVPIVYALATEPWHIYGLNAALGFAERHGKRGVLCLHSRRLA